MTMIEGSRAFGARHEIFRKHFITQIINAEFKIREQSIELYWQSLVNKYQGFFEAFIIHGQSCI